MSDANLAEQLRQARQIIVVLIVALTVAILVGVIVITTQRMCCNYGKNVLQYELRIVI